MQLVAPYHEAFLSGRARLPPCFSRPAKGGLLIEINYAAAAAAAAAAAKGFNKFYCTLIANLLFIRDEEETEKGHQETLAIWLDGCTVYPIDGKNPKP